MSPEELITAAEQVGATVVRASGSTIVVFPAKAATADDLIPIADAASIAKCSVRTLAADARSQGWLRGKQRSRVVRRSDLDRYIDGRARPLPGPDDDGMDRRIARIEKARAAKEARRAS